VCNATPRAHAATQVADAYDARRVSARVLRRRICGTPDASVGAEEQQRSVTHSTRPPAIEMKLRRLI